MIALTGTDKDTVQVPDSVTHIFESLVGIFMLFLGSIGMVRACRKRPSAASLQQTTSVDGVVQMDELPLTAGSTSGDDSIAPTLMGKGEASMSITDIRGVGGGTSRRSPTDLDSQASSFDSRHRGTVLGTACSRCIQKLSSKMLACFIGIVHGVAGPGGVLGVIPAVQLKDWRYSSIYLGSFCISSTVVMGCFAALYGTCSRKLGKDRGQRGEFIMECISASLSIIVGILWLTLLACGKLEDVFP